MSDNTVRVVEVTPPFEGDPELAPQAPPPAGTTAPTRLAVELEQADLQALEFLRTTLRIPARGGPRGGLQGLAGALKAAVRIASKSAAVSPKAACIAAGMTPSEAIKRLGIGAKAAATRAAGRAANAKSLTVAEHAAAVNAADAHLLPGEKVDLSKPARGVEPFFTTEGVSEQRGTPPNCGGEDYRTLPWG